MSEPGSAPVTSPTTEPDPYAVLGIGPDADEREIARAYRRAARRTHPDMGGSAAEFAVVQAAWEALSDPAEILDDQDVWDLADWGTAAVEPDDDAAPAAAAQPADPEPPSADGPAPDAPTPDLPPVGSAHPPDRADLPSEAGAAARPPAHPGAARTPYAAGAVRLPEPRLGTPRRAQVRTYGPLDRALLGTGLVLAGLAAGSVAVAGAHISENVYVLAETWVVAWSVGIAVGRHFGTQGLVRWVPVWALLSAAPLSFAVEGGELSPAALVLLAGVGLSCAALAWWLVRRAHRAAMPSTRLREAERAGRVLERHRIAGEWNLVREALAAPGSTVERLLDAEPSRGARCWTSLDARTGQSRSRCLDLEVQEGTWLVFDQHGRVLAVAPPRAKDAWVEAVRRGTGR